MGLKKELGFIEVFSIASGAMISSGIFILPGIAFGKTGPSVFLSYFIAGILAFVGILSLAELSTAMPKAGGDYFYVTRTLGGLVGTVSGILSWFALSLKSAFAIVGIAEILRITLGVNPILSSLALALLFVIINILGVKEAGRFQVILVILLLSLILWYLVFGFSHVQISNFEPFAPSGTNAIFTTAGFVFVSFGGLLTAASISEEVKNPRKNIPAGLLAALVAVTILYTLIPIVAVGVLEKDLLQKSLTPVADAARQFAGSGGYIVIGIASLLAFVTTAHGGILSASRYPLALSRDGLLPPALGKVRKKAGTPVYAVLITGIFIMLSLLIKLDVLVKAASTVVLLTNILASLSLIIFRESTIQNYRPSFKVPLYPWLQIASIVFFTFLIFEMGLQSFFISTLFILAGICAYLLYGRRHSNQEYALLHLIERITDKKLTSHNLDAELKKVLFERDQILQDEFDQCIENALVFDYKEPIDLSTLFNTIAQSCQRLDTIDKNTILKLLMEREAESSTVINPFVAVPHLVLEGDGIFRLFLVRSNAGVIFSKANPYVKAVFVLAGTRDRRNLHLRALAAIAQIVQESNFERLWNDAKDEQGLKDVLLLSHRRRNL